MSARALVLGGRTGLLGQALMRTLDAHAWEVTALGREDLDLLNVEALAAAVDHAQPDAIFNTVAWTQVDAAEDDKDGAMRWNRALPSSLARMVKKTSTLLVHYSTDFIFSGQSERPYTEDDAPAPASVYGASKWAGEQAIMEQAPDNACILRTAWLFGPGRKNFVTTILNACHKRDTISVVHDQTGSPTYSLDLAHWSVLMAQKRATGIYHAVNGGRASWCELACEAVTLADTSCRVEAISSAQWPQKASRPQHSVLDTSRLAAVIGMAPRPWPQALRDYLFKEWKQGQHT